MAVLAVNPRFTVDVDRFTYLQFRTWRSDSNFDSLLVAAGARLLQWAVVSSVKFW